MTDLSNYLKDALLRHLLRGEYYNPPVVIYVALFNFPTFDDGSTVEITAGGYARQSVRFAIPNQYNESRSISELRFGPASENWGEITHFALYDAPEGGNMLLHGPVDVATVLDAGEIFVFDLGGVIVSFQ